MAKSVEFDEFTEQKRSDDFWRGARSQTKVDSRKQKFTVETTKRKSRKRCSDALEQRFDSRRNRSVQQKRTNSIDSFSAIDAIEFGQSESERSRKIVERRTFAFQFSESVAPRVHRFESVASSAWRFGEIVDAGFAFCHVFSSRFAFAAFFFNKEKNIFSLIVFLRSWTTKSKLLKIFDERRWKVELLWENDTFLCSKKRNNNSTILNKKPKTISRDQRHRISSDESWNQWKIISVKQKLEFLLVLAFCTQKLYEYHENATTRWPFIDKTWIRSLLSFREQMKIWESCSNEITEFVFLDLHW